MHFSLNNSIKKWSRLTSWPFLANENEHARPRLASEGDAEEDVNEILFYYLHLLLHEGIYIYYFYVLFCRESANFRNGALVEENIEIATTTSL